MEAAENSILKEAYIASFAAAMKDLEDSYKYAKVKGKAYAALKREGLWDAETLSLAYVAIVGKFSSLSRRLRDYILQVGALAKRHFDNNQAVKDE